MDAVLTPLTASVLANMIELVTANIDNPTELNVLGTAVEDMRLVHENVAGSDRATFYRLDTSSASVSAPWVMASATAGLRWVAICGYACNQAVKIANALSILDATDHTKILTWTLAGLTTGITLTLNPTSSTSQTLNYPNIATTDTLATLGLASQTFTGAIVLVPSSAITPLTITGGTVTTAQSILSATQTWNGSGITFTGISLNVTNTLSSAASNLINLMVGGTPKFRVSVGGIATAAAFQLSLDGSDSQTDAFKQINTGATAGWNAQLSASGHWDLWNFTGSWANIFRIQKTGEVIISASTDATGTTTGSLTSPGGASISKTLIHAKGRGAGVAIVATVAGTVTLTSTSAEIQTFTGSTAGTVIQFPAANLFGAGIAVLYVINNQSSVTVTPTRAGGDTFQGGGTTDPVTAGTTTRYASDGVSKWLKV